ncbi:hypothetical protein KO516_15655 [Citreicella sp. C3M06]|uniref:hypothetical protein n=1 Tax=Citreicella sp. C3M06 TaxID=2841564 RepID=UPI001C0930E0|nr:hypothetical protein [Citreicella sp. C3M06]MBU2962223.1 hypothetical protein [Citreicella sp. C3M06]
MAQSDAEDVVEHLAVDGFEVLDIRRTLLGRLRFRAQRGDILREVVLNPSTGVILRDYVTRRRLPDERDGDRGGQRARGNPPSGPRDRPTSTGGHPPEPGGRPSGLAQ